MSLESSFPLLGGVRLFAVFAAFVWPGVRAVALWDRGRRLDAGTRLALGFALAFGAFAALEAPLLLAHRSSDAALAWAIAAWLGATLALEWRGRRARQRTASPDAAEAPALRLPVAAWRAPFALALVASLAAATLLARHALPLRFALPLCGLLGVANAALALACLRAGRAQPAEGETPARATLARLARAGFALVAVVGLVSALVFVREDKDDTLYLSEALELVDAEQMGRFAAADRGEALPATPVYAWQAFELFAALAARLSSLHPVVVMRTAFAPLAIGLAFLLWLALLRRILPAWAVWVAALLVAAYFVFGASSHWAANNFLLPRPQQGKTWLANVMVPALVLLAGEWMERGGRAALFALLLVAVGAVGCAPTGVFLVPGLLGPLALAWWAVEPSRVRLLRALGAGAATLPGLAFGLWVALTQDEAVEAAALSFGGEMFAWHDSLFGRHLNVWNGGGALETFALIALPLLLVTLPERRQLAWPLAFTLLFLATTGNPALHPLLEGEFLGPAGYDRIFWLVPFPVLLAVPAVALVALATRRGAGAGALALAACLAAFPLAGAKFVFSSANVYFDKSFLPPPYLAENPYKIPADLFALARQLAAREHGPDARILCSERSAAHLAPLVPAFSFVFSRTYQTGTALIMAGRGAEVAGRERLAREFLRGELGADEALALLASTRTAYVVTDDAREPVAATLAQAGFRESVRSGAWALWERGD